LFVGRYRQTKIFCPKKIIGGLFSSIGTCPAIALATADLPIEEKHIPLRVLYCLGGEYVRVFMKACTKGHRGKGKHTVHEG
jgi:hypothetical protein